MEMSEKENLNVLALNVKEQLLALNCNLERRISEDKVNSIINAFSFVFTDWMPAQKELDYKLSGEKVYDTLKTNKGKHVNYGLCMHDEIAELVNSTPWKHWKDINGVIDYENIKTELVDQLHFIPAMLNILDAKGVLSDVNAIFREVSSNASADDVNKLFSLNACSMYYAIINFKSAMYNDVNPEFKNTKVEHQDYSAADEVGFDESNVTVHAAINYVNSKDYVETAMINRYIATSSLLSFYMQTYFLNQFTRNNDKPDTIDEIAIELILIQLLNICLAMIFDLYAKLFTYDISIDTARKELWELYIVKNCLNLFRAEHGYKEGTYHKMWLDEEDNVVAVRLAKDMQSIYKTELTKENLYNALESYYDLYVLDISLKN